MKIPIIISKLTDSPYSSEMKDAFHFDDDGVVAQLVSEIVNARPSSFLISGYRGVGKTSFVNRLQEKLDNKTIFINVSLARYDGYPAVIKKVIRQLYLEFKKINDKGDSEEVKSLSDRFALLYDRTFYEIIGIAKDLESGEHKRQVKIGLDVKKLTALVFLIGSSLNISLQWIDVEIANYLLLMGSLAWVVISNFDLAWSRETITSTVQEVSRKTLYDDEIAEHHLFQILKEIKSCKLNTVIVFDEIDKIESVKIIEGVINDIKVLLLSGYANFFLIAGQGLYYQLEKAQSSDDAVVSSLFSKKIHIPFLKYASLKNYVFSLVEDSELLKNKLVNDFVNSLVLESGRIPRRLANLIRHKLVWENEKPFLIIEEERENFYEQDSRLFSIMAKITDNDLPNFTNSVVKLDFFIAHLHIWCTALKERKGNSFSVQQIIDNHKHDAESPSSYTSQLFPLFELLLDRLSEEGMLVKKEEKNGTQTFSWNTTPQDQDTNAGPTDSNNLSLLIPPYNDLEKTVRAIYYDKNNLKSNEAVPSLKKMITDLVAQKVFNKAHVNPAVIDEITMVRNKIVQGLPIEENDQQIIERSKFSISRLRSEIIEDYVFSVLENHLDDYNFSRTRGEGFDFIAISDSVSLAFEVRNLNMNSSAQERFIHELLDKFSNLKKSNGLINFCIVFFYQMDKTRVSTLTKLMNVLPVDIRPFFFFHMVSEGGAEVNSIFIESRLQEALDTIVQVRDTHYIDREEAQLQNSKAIIHEIASREWPNDFRMQQREIERQEAALNSLRKSKPNDITEQEFLMIRAKAEQEWPKDFAMRYREEQHQIDALRKLKNNRI